VTDRPSPGQPNGVSPIGQLNPIDNQWSRQIDNWPNDRPRPSPALDPDGQTQARPMTQWQPIDGQTDGRMTQAQLTRTGPVEEGSDEGQTDIDNPESPDPIENNWQWQWN